MACGVLKGQPSILFLLSIVSFRPCCPVEVKKAKADAIEQEDYGKAQEFKKKQDLLNERLASIKNKVESYK